MKKTALFIGGTGRISAAITRLIAAMPEKWELYLLNRGNRPDVVPDGVKVIKADINDEEAVANAIKDLHFDCVCDFIGFVPSQVERDYRLFKGRTEQYMYISSASAYQKPVRNPIITENTPLENPFWQYSRDKIACEDFLMEKYRAEGYPVTIIRPSHTYDERSLPVGVHGANGSWQIIKRMLEGKKVIVHGDGSSLWTLTFNRDFAKGFVGLMGNQKAIGEALHITSDESLSWNQIYEAAAAAFGVEYKPCYVPTDIIIAAGKYDMEGNLTGDKANSVVFDNSKLKSLVPDFKATTSYAEGARIVAAYIMEHPECQKEDPEFDAWCDNLVGIMEKTKNILL